MNGLALTILVGQLPKLFGFSVDADGLIDEATGFVAGLADGETVPRRSPSASACLAVILLLQRLLPKIPGRAGRRGARDRRGRRCSTWRTTACRWSARCPRASRRSRSRPCRWPTCPLLVAGALGHRPGRRSTDTISTASAFAARTRRGGRRQPGDDRHRRGERRRRALPGLPGQHERVAHGGGRAGRRQDPGHRRWSGAAVIVADAAASCPGCCATCPSRRSPPSSSPRRSRSPTSPGMRRLWRQRRTEFVLSIGRVPRRGAARRAARHRHRRRPVDPQRVPPGVVAVPGRCSGGSRASPGYHDTASYPDAEQLPGLVIFRFDAPLFFANARTFRDQIRRWRRPSPRPRWIVVAAEPITDVDTTAADMLAGSRRGAQRARHHPGVRRDEGPGARRRSSATS